MPRGVPLAGTAKTCAEKTVCVRGHSLLDDTNVLLYRNPKTGRHHRRCRACNAELSRYYRQRRRTT